MDETRPEVGEIIPSSGGQKKKIEYHLLFGKREPVSLNFRALGQLFWFFVASFIFLFIPLPADQELRFAWSHLAFCWVSSRYCSSRSLFLTGGSDVVAASLGCLITLQSFLPLCVHRHRRCSGLIKKGSRGRKKKNHHKCNSALCSLAVDPRADRYGD